MFECSECDEPGRGCGCRPRVCGAEDRPGAVPRPRGHLQQPVGLREVAAQVPDGRWQVSTCGRRGQQTGELPQFDIYQMETTAQRGERTCFSSY